MFNRKLIAFSLLLLVLACATPLLAAPESFPPRKPEPIPDFHIPAVGNSLDEPWMFVDTLFDASILRPDLYSAFPVELNFSHAGRGYLVMLHTIFRTTTYGESWTNLDLAPPPSVNVTWDAVRSPAFIYGAGLRKTATTESSGDSLFLAVTNADGDNGYVRLLRDFDGVMTLWSFPLLSMNRWLTETASSTPNFVVAFAGLDGKIYRQNLQSTLWDTLDYNFFGTWVDDLEVSGSRMIAAGSHHIISEDDGATWNVFPAADPNGERDLSFAPDGLHGLACGETESGGGWVRYTEDGGATWSERTLISIEPLRTVVMVNADEGYAGGGNINTATGRIHRTIDGGRTWELGLLCDAEIRTMNVSRYSAAYVNVVAAGAFPDFSCGVWRTRIFAPADSGPILIAEPDSLDFGWIEVDTFDTLSVTVRNIGSDTIVATGAMTGTATFQPLWGFEAIEFAPEDEYTFDVVYAPTTVGTHTVEMSILNSRSDNVKVYLTGEAGTNAAGPGRAPLPDEPGISIWPNPGNAEFSIRYELPAVQNIALVVYDLAGREVAVLERGQHAAGQYTVNWNGTQQASGLYFVRLETNSGACVTKKLLLIK